MFPAGLLELQGASSGYLQPTVLNSHQRGSYLKGLSCAHFFRPYESKICRNNNTFILTATALTMALSPNYHSNDKLTLTAPAMKIKWSQQQQIPKMPCHSHDNFILAATATMIAVSQRWPILNPYYHTCDRCILGVTATAIAVSQQRQNLDPHCRSHHNCIRTAPAMTITLKQQ